MWPAQLQLQRYHGVLEFQEQPIEVHLNVLNEGHPKMAIINFVWKDHAANLLQRDEANVIAEQFRKTVETITFNNESLCIENVHYDANENVFSFITNRFEVDTHWKDMSYTLQSLLALVPKTDLSKVFRDSSQSHHGVLTSSSRLNSRQTVRVDRQ